MGGCNAVAFFRNINLGHRGSPTSEQLLGAFFDQGAENAQHLQSNGTVIYWSQASTPLARRVARSLSAVCGWNDYVAVRSATWCIELGRRLSRLASPEELPHLQVALLDAPRYERLPNLGMVADFDNQIVDVSYRHVVISARREVFPSTAARAVDSLIPTEMTFRSATTMVRLANRLLGARPGR